MQTLRGTAALAYTTWLEAVRSRLLLVGLLFALVLVAISVAAASVSFGERSRLIVDVGLAAASALGSLVTIALAVTSFAGELDKRTAYTLLARPIPRAAFVLGKYLGVVAAAELLVLIMVIATAITVWLFGDPVPAAFWAAWWLTAIEIALVAAVAELFASLAVPVLAAAYAVGVFLAGNLAADILAMAARLERDGSLLVPLLRALYRVFPDLQQLSLRTQAANDLPVPWDYLATGTAYGLAYVAAALALCVVTFDRRRSI